MVICEVLESNNLPVASSYEAVTSAELLFMLFTILSIVSVDDIVISTPFI